MSTESREFVIVGAGFPGLGVAIALRRAGFDDVLIVDEADAVGGVWRLRRVARATSPRL
jgi:cation diffusion facilitator CzcD-associated flavoprotein CzcO